MRRNYRLQQEIILAFFNFLGRIWKSNMAVQYLITAIICEGLGQVLAPDIEWILLRFVIFNVVWACIVSYKEQVAYSNFIREATTWMQISPYEFEHECARVLRKNGFNNVTVTRGSGDGGVDIIFYKENVKYIAQCKQYTKKVGCEPVRALYGVKEDFRADVVVMIATNGVTKGAYEFIANKRNYILWTLKDIIKMDRINSVQQTRVVL